MVDRRFVAGVVLVVSALVGALVFTAGASPARVLAASRDIPAGQVLVGSDLATVPLEAGGDTLRHLLAEDQRGLLLGHASTRHLRAGQLLAATDVAPAGPPLREVSIPVGADHAPSGRIGTGDRVDVLATYGEAVAARTVVVAHDVEVVSVASQQALIGGGDAGAVAAVTITCDGRTASLIVFAARSAKVDVVRAVGPGGLAVGPVGFEDLAPALVTTTVPGARR